jgi:rare lipoprotein A
MKILLTGLILSILSTSSYADLVSYYGRGFHGKKTASGEVFNQNAMTAASNSHKMGTKLKVTNVATGKSVIVKINDTGGFSRLGRRLDLSQGAFAKIAPLGQGICKVKIERL